MALLKNKINMLKRQKQSKKELPFPVLQTSVSVSCNIVVPSTTDIIAFNLYLSNYFSYFFNTYTTSHTTTHYL